MKIYAIKDEELNNRTIGYLFHYEKAGEAIMELCDWLDEWSAPLLCQHLVRNKIYTVPREITMLWLRERVIPSGRQNIGLILKNANLKEYDEMALLKISKGRCSQDDCYISEVEIEEVESDIIERRKHNLSESFVAEDGQIICLYKDNTSWKVDLNKLVEYYPSLNSILNKRDLLETVKVGIGGYSIVFCDSIEIQAYHLREIGTQLPLSAKDFECYIQIDLIDTMSACEIMQCSRQNLSYFVKRKVIKPVIKGAKENIYTKGAIEEIRNW